MLFSFPKQWTCDDSCLPEPFNLALSRSSYWCNSQNKVSNWGAWIWSWWLTASPTRDVKILDKIDFYTWLPRKCLWSRWHLVITSALSSWLREHGILVWMAYLFETQLLGMHCIAITYMDFLGCDDLRSLCRCSMRKSSHGIDLTLVWAQPAFSYACTKI